MIIKKQICSFITNKKKTTTKKTANNNFGGRGFGRGGRTSITEGNRGNDKKSGDYRVRNKDNNNNNNNNNNYDNRDPSRENISNNTTSTISKTKSITNKKSFCDPPPPVSLDTN